MMISDTIERIRKRRNDYLNRKNSALNERIKQVRTEIVKLSFQSTNKPSQQSQLQEELAGLKFKLKQGSH